MVTTGFNLRPLPADVPLPLDPSAKRLHELPRVQGANFKPSWGKSSGTTRIHPGPVVAQLALGEMSENTRLSVSYVQALRQAILKSHAKVAKLARMMEALGDESVKVEKPIWQYPLVENHKHEQNRSNGTRTESICSRVHENI